MEIMHSKKEEQGMIEIAMLSLSTHFDFVIISSSGQ
jgi:hypothetical protein